MHEFEDQDLLRTTAHVEEECIITWTPDDEI